MWIWIVRGGGSRLMALSLALIIGGATGNGIDRVTLGGVADFFLLHAWGYNWYVFNIADVAIVAGVLGLLYDAAVGSLSRNDAAKPS
jgi:signal peptidase II